MGRQSRIWVHESFKRKLKKNAALQDKSILELTKDYAESDEENEFYKRRRRTNDGFRM